MSAEKEKATATFDGAEISPIVHLANRDWAIVAARGLWADSIDDQRQWHENEYLRGMVELLADTFGSPFAHEVDWDAVKDWYAHKIGAPTRLEGMSND